MKTTKLLTAILVAVTLPVAGAFGASDVPKDYPLKTCPVSGEEVGSGDMKPFKVSHEGTDVWLCCKSCKPKFDKDPAKYTKAVKDAAPKK